MTKLTSEDLRQFTGLKDYWQAYEETVVPATAGKGQREDTRSAFFAGASAVLSFLELQCQKGKTHFDDSWDSLSKELDDFVEETARKALQELKTHGVKPS